MARLTPVRSTRFAAPYLEDQRPLMAEERLHPVCREPNEIEARLEKREVL